MLITPVRIGHKRPRLRIQAVPRSFVFCKNSVVTPFYLTCEKLKPHTPTIAGFFKFSHFLTFTYIRITAGVDDLLSNFS